MMIFITKMIIRQKKIFQTGLEHRKEAKFIKISYQFIQLITRTILSKYQTNWSNSTPDMAGSPNWYQN